MRKRRFRRINSLHALQRVSLKHHDRLVIHRLRGRGIRKVVVDLPGRGDVMLEQPKGELHVGLSVLAHGAVDACACCVGDIGVGVVLAG